ncbi:MAG: aromatic ring-hydroxylating dioxygenase subunit alpha [Rubrivivax sp.]
METRLQASDIDQGTAYGLAPGVHDKNLTEVGAGTPMGELLRRYWHPVGLARDAGSEPKPVRVLGEDLILFRDGHGRAGLLHARCAHRGASLYYGRVEAEGLRCCYHGWLRRARPLPRAALRARWRRGAAPQHPPALVSGRGTLRPRLRLPGPAGERKPLLPAYDVLDAPGAGEFIEADDTSLGGGGPPIIPCNWLQHYENVVDSYHVPILHGTFSGTQFVPAMAQMTKVQWSDVGRGVQALSWRTLEDGGQLRRVTQAVLPTLRVVPSPRLHRFGPVESIGWVLPIDDTHFRIYVAGRVREAGEIGRMRSKMNGRFWWELSEEEHRRFPGDYEAQVSQGAIAAHSAEHLRTSDRGIALLRRLLRRQLDVVAAGGDPVGVERDPARAQVLLADCGNFRE